MLNVLFSGLKELQIQGDNKFPQSNWQVLKIICRYEFYKRIYFCLIDNCKSHLR